MERNKKFGLTLIILHTFTSWYVGFDTPSFLHINWQDISASHSGWYWCSLSQGSKELEASVFVEVIGDDLTIEATTQTSTQASNDVSGITEIVDDLELSIKQIEQTTVAAAEEPSTEVSDKIWRH